MELPLPRCQGQFDGLPRDPVLTVELLVLERCANGEAGLWEVTGALTRPEGGPAAWVDGFADDPGYGGADAGAQAAWEYLTDKCGGNGYTFEVAFMWIANTDDARRVIAHVNETLLRDRPLRHRGPTDADIASEEPVADQLDPCAPHHHLDDLPFHVSDALSWRLTAELMRRHPDELWAIRTHPNDLYDCLTVCRRSAPLEGPVIRINRNGSHADYSWFGSQTEPSQPTYGLVCWTDYLFSNDPRAWMTDLEQRVGLAPHSGPHPRSTPASLTMRWIAQFLSAQIGSHPRWTAWTVIDPTADPMAHSFDLVEPAARWAMEAGQHLGVWFVGTHDGDPRFALSWTGDLWSIAGDHWHLPSERRRGESITSLIARTSGSTLP